MRYVTSSDMARLEKEAEFKYGIPARILMENAGRSVSDTIQKMYGKQFRRITIICGQGNNGGDGYVAARHLWNKGFHVSVVSIGDTAKLKTDAAANLRIVKLMKIPFLQNPDFKTLRKKINASDLLVDALFGTGLKRKLSEPYATVIREINRNGKKVVSIDIPSGIDADTGERRGYAVKSDLTVSLGYSKVGILYREGRSHSGPTVVVDISIPYHRRRNRLKRNKRK